MIDRVRDAEKRIIKTATLVHATEHDCSLIKCKNSICKALAFLAKEKLRSILQGEARG
jgi:hypothetical protein